MECWVAENSNTSMLQRSIPSPPSCRLKAVRSKVASLNYSEEEFFRSYENSLGAG